MSENPLPDALPLGSSTGAEERGDHDRPFPTPGSLPTPVSAVAFWLAIALPALYLPLLLAGLSTVPDLAAFLGLFGLHLAALVGGRSYRREA